MWQGAHASWVVGVAGCLVAYTVLAIVVIWYYPHLLGFALITIIIFITLNAGATVPTVEEAGDLR